MPVAPGQSLLHYRIVERIGEGGMGVVWKAEDTSLGRTVAIKLLPDEWAGDADRLQRFEREARVLAALNHPNVATVHGLHEAQTESGPVRFIAMEWVPGEDLASRLQRGALDLERTLAIARQVARGLEAAHAAGIVHRDLKPANILVTPDGRVKVLDFGLAKGATASPADDPQMSPTLTSAGTMAGAIMGTAAYMAPEQAKGRPVDKRADVWAFGVVLYEMLTGTRAFRGEDIADTMASVLKLEPDFAQLPPTTPEGVRRLLRRCLQKDPDRRLRDIADARIELDEVDLDAAVGAPTPSPIGVRTRRSRPLPIVAAALAGLVAGALLWSFVGQKARSTSASASSAVRRSSIPPPDGLPFNRGDNIALSRDGTLLAVAVGLDDKARIYLRRLDTLEAEPIPGTEGAFAPFFSPDGRNLAFFSGGELKTVALAGGGRDVTVLCDTPTGRKGTWDDSGWIWVTFGESRLGRVRENGGAIEEIDTVQSVYSIDALPGSRGILLTYQEPGYSSVRKDTSTLAVLSPDGKTVKTVMEGGYAARYLPSGHLVFVRAGGLFAVPFDLERLEATPPAVSVQPNVRSDSVWGVARYAVADDGTLVFVSGGDLARTVPTWIDLTTGNEQPLPIPPGVRNNFDLSPDGSRVAIQDATGAQDQVWIFDARRATFTRLTEAGANINPVWSHDGREIFFASNREGRYRLFRKPIDGSAPASRLMTDEQSAMLRTQLPLPSSVTPDGRYLLISTWASEGRGLDLWKVPLDGSGDPEPVLATEFNEVIPQVSRDGKWLAYSSDRTGPYRLMVRPFPDVERGEWVISDGDAYDPRWSPRGDALLFRRGWGRLMSVAVGDDPEFSPGMARELMETDFHDAAGSSFAVSPDGKHVLVNKPVEASFLDTTPITLVSGWAGEVSKALQNR